ncbi:MAG: ribbon-helix-helix protein, CopG family [Caldilinea sp. CFX5]|nr:ribbon-helix-helix protein, CopG family [Caldilinea sp. CFX5]
MKTIQMTIDEELLVEVDATVAQLKTNRSAFMREALLGALRRLRLQTMEAQHRRGYAQQPVHPDEFDGWETEQVWGAP